MSAALNKRISKVSAAAGVWVYTVDSVAGMQVGARVDIEGFPTAQWNISNEQVTAFNADLLTVTVSHGNATVTEQAAVGQLHLHCHWLDTAFMETLLGYTPEGDDFTWLETCVDAANDWAYERRSSAGWDDLPTVAPGHNALQGTALYCLNLYRQKGSVDTFPTFTDTPMPGLVGSMGEIKRLLRIDRAGVA